MTPEHYGLHPERPSRRNLILSKAFFSSSHPHHFLLILILLLSTCILSFLSFSRNYTQSSFYLSFYVRSSLIQIFLFFRFLESGCIICRFVIGCVYCELNFWQSFVSWPLISASILRDHGFWPSFVALDYTVECTKEWDVVLFLPRAASSGILGLRIAACCQRSKFRGYHVGVLLHKSRKLLRLR